MNNTRPACAVWCVAACLGLLILLAVSCASPDPPTLSPTSTPTRERTPTALPPTATLPPSPTSTAAPTATATAAPTSTPSPTPAVAAQRIVAAFVSDWAGDDDIYLLDLETGTLANLTHGPGEDRDPAFVPGGQALVYRSNQDGHWLFYQIDLQTGERTLLPGQGEDQAYRGRATYSAQAGRYAYESYRDGNLNLYLHGTDGADDWLTQNPRGDYGPAWRPGAEQVAFASWREGDKDLYLIDLAGKELTQLTQDPADSESPAWHPDGQRLVFVHWVDWDADLYEMDVASGQTTRLTDDPYPDLWPAFAPDGRLLWTRYMPGEPFEVHDPYRPGHWALWQRDAQGREQQVGLPSGMNARTPAAAMAVWPVFSLPALSSLAPTPTPTRAPGELVPLVELDVNCAGQLPLIPESLADDYTAWRTEIMAQTGYDFLGVNSDMFRRLGYARRDYGQLSWHRTGRVVDTYFEWHSPTEGPNLLMVMRETLGPQTYWRLYLKTREQDGSMGEPLTIAPWAFWFNLDRAREPEAYAAGGRPEEIVPAGYYVDITQLAARHGYYRIASYEEDDFDWRTDSVGREFWHYQHADGLTWWEAMLEIYPLEKVEAYYSWQICTEELHIKPAWLVAKGIPTPAPTTP